MAEYYRSKCFDCELEFTWIGYKTAIGKTEEQLERMHRDQTICHLCGSSNFKTKLDYGRPLSEDEIKEMKEYLSKKLNNDNPELLKGGEV